MHQEFDLLSPNFSEEPIFLDIEALSRVLFGENRLSSEPQQRRRRRGSLLMTNKVSKRDSFLLDVASLDFLESSNVKTRRNSLLSIADASIRDEDKDLSDFLEVLDVLEDQETKQKTSSRRNSLVHVGKMSRRDSFLTSLESIELPKLTSKQRSDFSSLVVTELIGNDSKHVGIDSSKKFSRRNSLFLADQAPKRRRAPAQEDEFSSKSKKRKSKRNSFLCCFDSDLPAVTPTKKRKLSSKSKSSVLPTNPLTVNVPTVKKLDEETPSQDAQSSFGKFLSLCQAMKSSEESQIRIHDWDRKMGLRRSHSKTMRNSMRSRKELLKFCSSQLFMTL